MRARIAAVAALAASFGAGTALADGASDLESLLSENVTTTASTATEKSSTAPATSLTLSSDDLRTYGIRTLDEAIEFLSLGLVTSRSLGSPDVGARGVLLPNDDGRHFLVLVNGHALNDPLYGVARFDQGVGVPFDLVDHIEVVIGPGSVLYGSNAMLGVINLITKDAADYRGGHVAADYEFGSSATVSAGAGVEFKLFGAKSELTVGAQYYDRFGPDADLGTLPPQINTLDGRPYAFRRDGPPTGVWGGTLRNANFVQAPSAMLRFRSGSFEVNVLASAYRHGVPYTTTGTNVDFDDPESSSLERALRVDVRHLAVLSPTVTLSSRAYADSFDSQQRVNRIALYGCFDNSVAVCQYYRAGRSEWMGLEERLSLDWLQDQSLVTLLGVDGRMRWVAAKEDMLDFSTEAPIGPTRGLFRESRPLFSPYVQQTWSPAPFLDLNAGARLDAEERFSPVISPRGAAAITPVRGTVFRAIYSQAFRAPGWIETDGSGSHLAPSGGLRPERVRSVEGSLEQRFGAHRVLFGVFRTWWEDLVEPHPLSQAEMAALEARGILPLTAQTVTQFQNLSSVDNFGYNAALDGTLATRRLSYGLNVTATQTRRHANGTEVQLPASPTAFGNARIAYAFGGIAPTLALAASYVGKRPVDREYIAGYERTYAPPLGEFRLTVGGPVPGVRGLAYRLSAAYATTSRSAYVVGPNFPSVVLTSPIDRFSAFCGLRYDFGGAEPEGRPE
ncbi:MAG TPA: TonB-dependent receptor [Polyangiaceae bacterium]|nr:TonB-dependent receptor [Polyangiaceae bacterium]